MLVVNNITESCNLYLETLQVSVKAAAGAERAWRVRLLCARRRTATECSSGEERRRIPQANHPFLSHPATRTVPRRLTGTDQRRKSPEGSRRNRTDRLFERREREDGRSERVVEAAAAQAEEERIRAGCKSKENIYS
ncbi:hypothetical protein M9H77_18312 [Catharanthus roseus]|uniref:Uncharacterized protein n=1 Tax=Catharanthus roseus TaxID=4058 RepID=A0ACC0B737_CATRO|nr:hypothetical protein M9H77_18312 [Catharanthus roseus]